MSRSQNKPHKPILNLLLVEKPLSIYEQLQIEEALLRTSRTNWCILNSGSIETAIVMGISSQIEEMIDVEKLRSTQEPISIIRRCSGGGTVIVDEETLFFTIILSKEALISDHHHPKGYMEWVHQILSPAFLPHLFTLQENDFTVLGKKIGGNAQYFSQDRMLHHTSFLWNWRQERMDLLHLPKKRPLYRQDRRHDLFCGKLSDLYLSPKNIVKSIIDSLSTYFTLVLKREDEKEIVQSLETMHRKTVERLFV